MSAPREHVEAVARAIRNHLGAGWNSSSLAKDILTPTDPAVRAAMLDALVRAGVLRSEWALLNEHGWPYLKGDEAHLDAETERLDLRGVKSRRYVTEWEAL